MNDIYLKKVEGKDVNFLYQLMNNTQIRLKLHECETTPKLWEDALLVWNDDTDEENYIICLDGNSIGWIGINGLDSINKKALGVRNFFCKLSFYGKIIFFRAGHSSCPIYNIS